MRRSRDDQSILEKQRCAPGYGQRTLDDPECTLPDPLWPERIHAIRRIPEHGDRVLRVVHTRSTDPTDPGRVVTVFFDRRLKGKL